MKGGHKKKTGLGCAQAEAGSLACAVVFIHGDVNCGLIYRDYDDKEHNPKNILRIITMVEHDDDDDDHHC